MGKKKTEDDVDEAAIGLLKSIDPRALVRMGKDDIFRRFREMHRDIEKIALLEEITEDPYFSALAKRAAIQENGAVVVLPERKPKALLTSGTHRAKYKRRKTNKPQDTTYAETRMKEAIVTMVGDSPGITTIELAKKLQDGGFPFKSSKPVNSVAQCAMALAGDGKIERKKLEDGRTRRNAYYPVNDSI